MMADWRKLYGKICENQELAECSLGANLLFERILTKTDDEGRYYADPTLINKLIFTARKDIKDKQIDKWLGELASKNLIKVYMIGKKKYLFFYNFRKYQQLRKDIKPKIFFPDPPVTDMEHPVTDMERNVDIRVEENRVEENRREEKKLGFRPPTIEEVTTYCKERSNHINPQAFLDHYEANGWVRGRTKIKDWKACVRTWETRQEPPCSVCGGKGVIERDNGYGGVIRVSCECRKNKGLRKEN